MSEQQHTAEPWFVKYQNAIFGSDNYYICSAEYGSNDHAEIDHEINRGQSVADANARRIVACINACAGFSIEELEGASLFNDSISAQDEIDSLKSEVEEMKLIIATDTGTESAVANLQQQVSHLVDMVACEKSNAEYFKRQRDELLALLVEFSEALPSDKYMEKQGQTPGPLLQRIRSAIASVKANTQ